MKIGYIFRDPALGGTSLEQMYTAISSSVREEAGYETINIYIKNNKNYIYNAKKLLSYNCDVYHHTGSCELYMPMLRRKKIVNSIPDIGTYKHLVGLKKWVYGLLWVRMAIWVSAKTTVISKYTKQDLEKNFRIFGTEVVHCPVDPSLKYRCKKSSNDRPELLFVGVAPHKNLDRLIEAIEPINCKLNIIGKLNSHQLRQLEIKKINYKNFYNLAYDEVIECYENSDILVFPSTHEGFGLPIIEANAVGRPVITSNICSMPEVAGDSAVFVDPYSVENMRESIVSLINDKVKREELVRNGLENIKRFKLSKITEKYLCIYNSI